VEKHGDRVVKNACREFYDRISSSTPKKFKLKDAEDVKKRVEELDLQQFQDEMDELVNNLNFSVYGQRVPELIRLRYQLPRRARRVFSAAEPAAATLDDNQEEEDYDIEEVEGEEDSESRKPSARSAIKALRKRRAALKATVRDPLEISRRIAARAVGGSRAGNDQESTLAASARSKEQRRNSSASSDEDSDDENIQLSDLAPPSKRRSIKSSHRYDTEHPPDDGLFDENGNVKVRRKWTDEEKTAVRLGVAKHGVGKWAHVKKEYADVLRNRTSVQIKDVWRTMANHGEIEPPIESEGG
jgi:hypothetical protein